MKFILLLLALLLWPTTGWSAAPACDIPTYNGRYCRFALQGWTIEVNERLVRESRDVTATVLEILDEQLAAIVERFPSIRVAELRRVLIWIEPAAQEGGQQANYHPTSSLAPQRNGQPSAMLGAVEIRNARYFIGIRKTQPAALMHEMAHAHHELVLGYDDKQINAAYENAVRTGLYKSVKRNNGSTEDAYALTNAREYFAELTEAFFGVNDFFPFNRVELQSYDPIGFEAVRAAWYDVAAVTLRETRGMDERCSSDGDVSPRSSHRTRLNIRNARNEPISLVWVDFRGGRRLDRTIAPGALWTERTFAGHRFRIEDGNGNCLAGVTADDTVSWIEIAP